MRKTKGLIDAELDDDVQWDPEIKVEKEKARALNILGQIVPQSEIFLKASNSEDPRKKLLHIKRFDPSNPHTFNLMVRFYLLYISFLEKS